MTNSVIENVRRSLGRGTQETQALQSVRPQVYPARVAESMDAELEQFLDEIKKLSGTSQRLTAQTIPDALKTFVREENIRKATLWDHPILNSLGIAQHLCQLGVEIVSPNADKHAMAQCDLGITTADYLLPETGTLVLRSSFEKPRGVSLLPRIHLALVRPEMLRADMHQVFAEAKNEPYLVFVTGPSRTADIELTVTLGVHGPKSLVVWLLEL